MGHAAQGALSLQAFWPQCNIHCWCLGTPPWILAIELKSFRIPHGQTHKIRNTTLIPNINHNGLRGSSKPHIPTAWPLIQARNYNLRPNKFLSIPPEATDLNSSSGCLEGNRQCGDPRSSVDLFGLWGLNWDDNILDYQCRRLPIKLNCNAYHEDKLLCSCNITASSSSSSSLAPCCRLATMLRTP